MACTCGRIKIGFEVTELRNWNPDCEAHGIGSDWYHSPEQVTKRETQNDRLKDLYRQVREARRKAKETNGC